MNSHNTVESSFMPPFLFSLTLHYEHDCFPHNTAKASMQAILSLSSGLLCTYYHPEKSVRRV